MNILVIGSGGREHAICFALRKSPKLTKLYCSPGNAGISSIAEIPNLNSEDFHAVSDFVKANKIELVVVGPEAPLVNGLADYLEKDGVRVFGCSKPAAQLEGSKKFTKDLAAKYNIPTGAYKSFTDAAEAKKFIKEFGKRIVVKADGLAAGKGVIVPETTEEALAAVDEVMGGKFGKAGNIVVIEEFLEGEEASFFALCDGENAIKFGAAQDHKRAFDGDKGPNTGGMGTYSPAPVVTKQVEDRVMKEIIDPTVAAMKKEGMPFKGVLFAGLMIKDGKPQLIEFNVRFGDPETQSLMLRLESDLVDLMYSAASGTLKGKEVKLADKAALCVVYAANGYPGDYQKGTEIRNLEDSEKTQGAYIFHAGTKKEGGKILATGGRVLGVSAIGKDVAAARKSAYDAAAKIDWADGFYRKDIAWRAMKN